MSTKTATDPRKNSMDNNTILNVKKEEKEPSTFAVVFANLMYAFTSAGLTFINKALYLNFGFQSPLDLLLIQCICNVLICTPLMIYKQYNPDSLQVFTDLGMRICPLTESVSKWRLGFKLGMFNLITVAFGIYSMKYVSIPLFLTFRRCSILTTFMVSFYLNRKYPDSYTLLKLGLVTTGALVAGLDTFDTNWFGYLLIWMNNLS